MSKDLSKLRVLYSETQLQGIVDRLGKAINDYYRDLTDEITAICILKGSVHFFSDLMKRLQVKIRYGFIHVSSYTDNVQSEQIVMKTWTDERISGKHILVVEDIVDTGNTLRFILNGLWEDNPADVKLVSLFDKIAHPHMVNIDFVGERIGDLFVVGYGLDYYEIYRNLPYVGYFPGHEGE